MGSLEVTDLPQDMTKEEKEVVLAFINHGCPGLLRVQQSDIFKYFELYMSGKTYAEIAVITKAPKDLIMYLAYKSKWLDHRFKHYENISLNILDKVQQVKLDTANNLVTIIKALGKYCEMKYNKFLTTNDVNMIESIDNKIVAQYYKSIELLEKVLNAEEDADPNKKPKQPLVNINVGMGARVAEQVSGGGQQTLEITDATSGDFLKALADMKKEIEKK
jgi:hypothetical protein